MSDKQPLAGPGNAAAFCRIGDTGPGTGHSTERPSIDEDQFNMALRKILTEVGVTSQREIERVVRAGEAKGKRLTLRICWPPRARRYIHLIEETIDLR